MGGRWREALHTDGCVARPVEWAVGKSAALILKGNRETSLRVSQLGGIDSQEKPLSLAQRDRIAIRHR